MVLIPFFSLLQDQTGDHTSHITYLKNSLKSTPLEVRKYQTRLLGRGGVLLLRLLQLLLLLHVVRQNPRHRRGVPHAAGELLHGIRVQR